jgi:hypothetical protein
LQKTIWRIFHHAKNWRKIKMITLIVQSLRRISENFWRIPHMI